MQNDQVYFFIDGEDHIVDNNLDGDFEQVFETIKMEVPDIKLESKAVNHRYIDFDTRVDEQDGVWKLNNNDLIDIDKRTKVENEKGVGEIIQSD